MAERTSNVRVGAEPLCPNYESATHAPGIQIRQAPSAGQITAAIIRLKDASPELHEHPSAQISFLFTGASAQFLTRIERGPVTRTTFHPGSIVYIAPGQPHRVQWQGTGEMLNLYFPEDFARGMTEQRGCELPSGARLHPADPGVRAISQLIKEELFWTDSLSESAIDHARFLMGARLIRSLNFEPARSAGFLDIKRLQPAVDAINAFPEKHFVMAELARLCNSSVFHFARSFAAHLGAPPFAYQRNLRIQKAQSLLRDTDLSIEAIACAVGIEAATNFSRMFRRFTGQSPKQFRRFAG